MKKSINILSIVLLIFWIQISHAQIFEFGFVNSDINYLLEKIVKKENSDIKLIGFSYYERNDALRGLDYAFLKEDIKPLLLKSRIKCKNYGINQDGEVYGIIDNKLYFVIEREFETGKYKVRFRDDLPDYEITNSLCKKMIELRLNQGFLIFDHDMSKYYVEIAGKTYYFNNKTVDFELIYVK